MSKKKLTGIEKLQQRMKEHVEAEKKESALRQKRIAKEIARREKREKAYKDWCKGFEKDAKKASKTIWNWYEKFIASDAFAEIVKSMQEVDSRLLRLTKNLVCTAPTPWGTEMEECQWLSISFHKNKQGALAIHNVVKYGKSYEIRSAEDFLKYVYPPILLEIGKLVESEQIWDHIQPH